MGSSPTEVNISFAFCVGVNHAQRRSKGDIQKCSQTIRSLQASPGPKLKSKQAISRFLEQQEGGYQLTNRDSQTQTFPQDRDLGDLNRSFTLDGITMRATSSVCRGFNLMRTGDEDTQHEPSQPHPIPRPPKCRSMIRIIVRLSNAIISQMLHRIRPRESKLNQGQSSSRLA